MGDWLRLLRIRHWLKNLLVLFPVVFAGRLADPVFLGAAIAAFFAFSLAASGVYAFNDIRDAERDRLHPVKKERPIASGAISERAASAVACALMVAAVAVTVLFAQQITLSLIILMLYIGLNVAYSLGAKAVPVLDAAILSFGFLLRVLYGGAFCTISISSWLFLTVLALSIFLALGKRRGEMDRYGTGARESLKRYPKAFLDKNMYVFLGLGLAFYSLWTIERMGGISLGADLAEWLMIAAVPLAMFACIRYSFDIERDDSDGDPVSVVLGDKPLLCLMALWAVVVVAGVYAA